MSPLKKLYGKKDRKGNWRFFTDSAGRKPFSTNGRTEVNLAKTKVTMYKLMATSIIMILKK